MRRTAWLFLLLAVTATSAAQSWRADALASFDEAWQTINDSFYEPSFGGIDWNGVKRELRPRVEQAASPEAARAVIVDMLGRLKRSHFGLLSSLAADALPGPASVPIDIRVIADGAVITRVIDNATSAGLAPGQRLISIDGRSVVDLRKGTEQLKPRAAALELWRRVNRELHGWEGSTAKLQVLEPSGAQRTVSSTRVMPVGESVTFGNLPPLVVRFDAREVTAPGDRRVGYIAFSFWLLPITQQLELAVDRFRKHDGIVIDLRGNPGGLAAMIGGVAGHFIGEPVLLGTMRTRQATLKFDVNPRVALSDGRKVDVYSGPLAILVDELTGSTSETFVGSLQGLRRARVFGRQTMGQALPALTKKLPSGDVLMYAIGDYTTSAGVSLEGAGVVPDAAVPLSIRALSEGRDEVLEAALQWLSRQRSRSMLPPPASRLPSAPGVSKLGPERVRLMRPMRMSWE